MSLHKAKRLKFSDNGMNRRTKDDFLLEINGNSSLNLNRDSNVFSSINYDLRKDQIDLSGFWSFGISYKNVKQNSKVSTIEILLIDAETNEPIDLNKHFILNLEFKRRDAKR